MGRTYCGDIEGKFWFGIQSSTDISQLVDIKYITFTSWKICGCMAEIQENNYCHGCYNNQEEHILDATEQNEFDDNLLYYEDENNIGYHLDKYEHYDTLIANMNEIKKNIDTEVLQRLDQIPQDDNILNAFSGVFNHAFERFDEIISENEPLRIEKSQLLARYILGYQIEYCLRINTFCNVYCEC